MNVSITRWIITIYWPTLQPFSVKSNNEKNMCEKLRDREFGDEKKKLIKILNFSFYVDSVRYPDDFCTATLVCVSAGVLCVSKIWMSQDSNSNQTVQRTENSQIRLIFHCNVRLNRIDFESSGKCDFLFSRRLLQ